MEAGPSLSLSGSEDGDGTLGARSIGENKQDDCSTEEDGEEDDSEQRRRGVDGGEAPRKVFGNMPLGQFDSGTGLLGSL
jgi:hypothetical protein